MGEIEGILRNGKRRGVAAVMVLVSLLMLLGVAALAVDAGYLYNVKTDMQRAADAAAMAGAWDLLDEDKLSGTPFMDEEIAAARVSAVQFVELNTMLGGDASMGMNIANDVGGDIVIGYLDDVGDSIDSMSFADPNEFNTVVARVRRDESHGGAVSLFFARTFGKDTAAVSAEAAAMLKDGVVGYRVPSDDVNASLLPLALHIDTWRAMLAGVSHSGDNYDFDSDSESVVSMGDGIQELNIYPGGGANQLPPGNFGTVDIGSANNSTADIARQIVHGVNRADLAHFGGELRLGDDGTLTLEGDTGLSASVKDDLEAILGIPRTVPLFNAVAGPGNNSVYTIVGFAGIRVMHVKLTGPMSGKEVIIQPAFVIDETAVTDEGSGNSYFVYLPVQLVK